MVIDLFTCVSNYLSSNTVVYGRFQDGAKVYASKKGLKFHGAKITLNIVLR